MSLLGYINLASNAGDTFTNAADSDFLLFTQSNSQKILLGVGSNSVASLTISSNLAQFNGNIAINNALAIKGLQITANDGSTANVTQTAVTGLSNDGGVTIQTSVTNSNYIRFMVSNEVARFTSNGSFVLSSNQVSVPTPYRLWDYSGTASDTGGAPGPLSTSNIFGAVTMCNQAPFPSINNEGSLYFPGTAGSYISAAQYGTLAATSNSLPDFTIEMWANYLATPGSYGFNVPYTIGQMSTVNGLNAWSFGMDANSRLTFYCFANAGLQYVTASTPLSNNVWGHHAVCYTAATRTLQMYINGVQQTLATNGTALSGNGTTTVTYSAAVNGNQVANLIVGQNSNLAINAYISSLRYVQNAVLYTSNFTPFAMPLEVYGASNTRLLLRAPLYNTTNHQNVFQVLDGVRVNSLPADAIIYVDPYGVTPASVGSNAPYFDSNTSRTVQFLRAASNYLHFPPQTYNLATKGFTCITRFAFTTASNGYERLLDIGTSTASISNNIMLYRNPVNNSVNFNLYNNGAAASINTSNVTIQNNPCVLAARYDPYTSNGTMSLFVNGVLNSSSNNQASVIGADRYLQRAYVGASLNGTADVPLSAHLYSMAVYNRALTDKELADAYMVLQDQPTLTRNNVLEVGNRVGRPALTVRQDGSIQTPGPIVGPGQTYAPVDYGLSNLSIPGYMLGNVAAVGQSPFGVSEGSLYFSGAVTDFVNLGTSVPVYTGGVQDSTFEAWVYITQTANINMVFNRPLNTATTTNDWGFYVNSTNNVVAFIFNASGTNNIVTHQTQLVNNTWNHIAMTVASSVIRVFVNGVVSSTTATISGNVRYVATSITTIGNYNATANNMFYGYITNLRIVSGFAAYTASFAPTFAPLNPSSLGTTLLLLRCPQATGRIQMPKLGGTSVVQAYPPAAMTAYATNMQNTAYGAGLYIASANSDNSSVNGIAYMAFDKINGTGGGLWYASSINYNTSGNYTGTGYTTEATGTLYQGDWVQLQMPVSISLAYYTIQIQPNTILNSPNTFYLFGSTNGTTWYVVNQQSGITGWTNGSTITFNASSQQAYSYYRLLATKVNAAGSTQFFAISELTLYGTQESLSVTPDGQVGIGVSRPAQALEVAGNATFNNIGAGNMGMFRNALINGDFRINQRGTTSAWPGVAGSTNSPAANTVYVADRWTGFRGGYATGSSYCWSPSTLGTADLPYAAAGIRNYVRAGRANGDTNTSAVVLSYALESADSYRFAGQTITLSCYVRAGTAFSASSSNINLQVASAPTTDEGFQRGLGFSSGINFPVSQNIPISTTWTRISASGSIPTNATQIALTIQYTPVGTASSTNDYIDITGVQLERGSMATQFDFRPYQIELQLCQRYCKAYTGTTLLASGMAINTTVLTFPMVWDVPWRAPGSLTLIPNTGNGVIVIDASFGLSTATNLGAITVNGGDGQRGYFQCNTSGLTAFTSAMIWAIARLIINNDL